MGPESRLVRAIVRAVQGQYPAAWVLKVHGSPYQPAGVPDLLVCLEGRLVGIEVKCPRPGESRSATLARTTRVQHHQIAQIQRAGGTAGVATSVAEALALVGVLQ